MTTPVGFTDFFILEAGDYVAQLDALLHSAGSGGPETEPLVRVARALRGSATMAKLTPFSELAAAIERVGRALHTGAISYNETAKAALVGAVEDCKLLVRSVRTWSAADDERARTRIAELAPLAQDRAPTPMASPATIGRDAYLATEASNIGAGLELIATRPDDRDAASNVLGRIRGLRGIATLKDHTLVGDVLEAAEEAVQSTGPSSEHGGSERLALLHSSATLLRAAAAAMRANTPMPAASDDITKFSHAYDAWLTSDGDAQQIVPIADLFFTDGSETVVESSQNPPTTPAERFRLEAAAQGEHIGRILSDASAAQSDPQRDRARRQLRVAMRSLDRSARSFGDRSVSEFIATHGQTALQFDASALRSLSALASALSSPRGPASVAERVSEMRVAPVVPQAEAPAPAPVLIAPAPADIAPAAVPAAQQMTPIASHIVPVAAISAEARATPAFASAAAAAAPAPPKKNVELLGASIEKLAALITKPLTQPIAFEEQPPVPIDVLLYRGRSAIERCLEIRNDARSASKRLDDDALAELFDLLDLALIN